MPSNTAPRPNRNARKQLEKERQARRLSRKSRLLRICRAACFIAGAVGCMVLFPLRDRINGLLFVVLGALFFTCFTVSSWCDYLFTRDHVEYEFTGPKNFHFNWMLYSWRKADPQSRKTIALVFTAATVFWWFIVLLLLAGELTKYLPLT